MSVAQRARWSYEPRELSTLHFTERGGRGLMESWKRRMEEHHIIERFGQSYAITRVSAQWDTPYARELIVTVECTEIRLVEAS